MNDFYKKSLSELLYESNKNEKLEESLVYTKGITSLLNEVELKKILPDNDDGSIHADTIRSIIFDDKFIDFQDSGCFLRIQFDEDNKHGLIAIKLGINSENLYVLNLENINSSTFNKKMTRMNLADILRDGDYNITRAVLMNIVDEPNEKKDLWRRLWRFYQNHAKLTSDETLEIKTDPQQNLSMADINSLLSAVDEGKISADQAAKMLSDPDNRGNTGEKFLNKLSYLIDKIVNLGDSEASDTLLKSVKSNIQSLHEDPEIVKIFSDEGDSEGQIFELIKKVVKYNILTQDESQQFFVNMNNKLAQINPESIDKDNEGPVLSRGSSSVDQKESEEAIKRILEDLPPIEKVREVESSIESQDEKIKRLKKSIEEILDIKKEEDFDPNSNNYLSKLEEIEKKLQEISQVKVDLEEISQYKNKDIFDTSVKVMQLVNNFEEIAYNNIDNTLRNDSTNNAGIAGNYNARKIKELIFSDSDLNEEDWLKFSNNCMDSFTEKDQNAEAYNKFFGELSKDSVEKYVASVANIANCVKQRKSMLEVFKSIASIINKASGYKVKAINASAFLDDTDFSEFVAAFKKVQEKNDQDIKDFTEKYEELSGKRADFLKKKDDEIKDVDNFENVLKNDIDVLFEPFKKLGIEINFDTIFENKKQKYLSGKLSNFLFEDAPSDPFASSGSLSSLGDEEKGGFDPRKISEEPFFDNPEETSKVLQQNANKSDLKALMMHLQIVKGIKQQQKEKEVKIPEFVLDLDEIVKKVKIGDAEKVAENITKIFVKEFVALDYSSRKNMIEEELKDMLLSTIERVFSDSSSMFESKIKNKNIISEGAIEGTIGRGFGTLIGSLGGVTGSIVVGELIGNLASKNNFITDKMGKWPLVKKIIGVKDINTRDFASTLLSSKEYVDMIKKVLQDALKVKILNYFVSIEDGLNKYSVTISMKNAANLRALKRQRKSSVASSKKFGNVTNQGSLFLSEVENSIYTTVMNLPFGNKFTRKSISAISDEFRKSKEFSKLVDAFQKDRLQLDHFVHDRGLSILLEEEDKAGKDIKPIIIDINKMFLEIRDIGKEAIDAKTSFGDFILQKVERAIDEAEGGNFIFVDDLSGIISRFTRISTKDIKQNLFESSYRRKNILLEDPTAKVVADLLKQGQTKQEFINSLAQDSVGQQSFVPFNDFKEIFNKFFGYDPDPQGVVDFVNQHLNEEQKASLQYHAGTDSVTLIDQSGPKPFVEKINPGDMETALDDARRAGFSKDAVRPASGTEQGSILDDTSLSDPSSAGSSATNSASASPTDSSEPPVEKADYSGYIKWGYFAIRSAYAISKEAKRGRIGKEVIKQKIRSERNIFSDAIAVNIAYHICSLIESRKSSLTEFSIKVTGNIEKMAPDRNVETDDKVSQNLLDDIKSNSRFKEFVVSKIIPKSLGGGKTTKREVSDSQILNSLRKNLSTVAIGITKLYDKPRYAKIIKASTSKQAFDLRRESFVSWYESNNSLDITNILTSEKEINKSEKLLNKEVKKDVDKLALFLLSFSKQVKGINESKVLHKNKLIDLLFEAPQRIKTNVKDLAKGLSASGILIYGSGLKPSSREFKEAENHLIGTVADFLYTNFDIEVEGAEQYNKLDPVKVNVERAVNKDAQKGEVASEEIAEATSESGAPLDMNSPASIEQLVSLTNMSGGNTMMMFMMMMMNQNFMQMMMQMQKDGASLQDMTEKVAEESDELSDFDKEIAYALKEKRAGLPEIGKREIKRIFKLLNDNPFKKLTYCQDLVFNKEIKDQRTFITNLKQQFNITDKKVVDYNKYIVEQSLNFVLNLIMSKKDYVQEHDLRHSLIELYALSHILCEIFDVDAEQILDEGEDLRKSFKETDVMIIPSKSEKYIELSPEGEFTSYKQEFYDEMFKQANTTKKEAQRIAEKYLTESSRRYNKPSLRRKIRKSKVISESEFLKNELKRLWKI